MDYQTLLNTNIKNLRNSHNLTQEEFAEKIGISVQGLSNLERNRYQPTAETVDKICKVFKISPVELLIEPVEGNDEIIKNIISVLMQCKKNKLKKIYEIILMLTKL